MLLCLLAKNTDKNVYTGYGIAFDSWSESALPDGTVVKIVNIFGVDSSSSVHIDNKSEKILILVKGPTQGLNDTTLTAEAQYLINFSRSNRKFCLILNYNGSNRLLFVNAIKLYQFKSKIFISKKYVLCWENISGDFPANNMKKQD